MAESSSNVHNTEKMASHGISHEGGGSNLNKALSVTLTPQQFEQLYLQPGGTASKGDLTKRFGNPTPVGVVGFLLSLTPLSMYLMGFGSSNATSAIVQAGPYIILGGVLELIAGVMEWILGNTFPMLVFFSFGGFYISNGILQMPTYGFAAAYSASGTNAAEGAATGAYNDSLAIYYVIWGVVTFVYLLASLRTNVTFVLLFFFLDFGFFILAAAYFRIPNGQDPTNLLIAAGAFFFLTALCGWWIFLALVMGSTGMPFLIPVGDLSGFLAPKSKAVDSAV